MLNLSCSNMQKLRLRETDNSKPLNFEVVWTVVRREWIERFHSRDQLLCKFIGTEESVYIRKEFNSTRICSVNQHGRRFIVLEHQYGRRDVMWKRFIITKKFF